MSLDKLDKVLEDIGFSCIEYRKRWKKGDTLIFVIGESLFVEFESVLVSFKMDEFEFEYKPGMLTVSKKGLSCMTVTV